MCVSVCLYVCVYTYVHIYVSMIYSLLNTTAIRTIRNNSTWGKWTFIIRIHVSRYDYISIYTDVYILIITIGTTSRK